MNRARADNVIAMPQQQNDWSKLIRKPRWIGMEDAARRLELGVRCLRPEEQSTVAAWPRSTDYSS